jgi:lysophospholipase L1-like esterase
MKPTKIIKNAFLAIVFIVTTVSMGFSMSEFHEPDQDALMFERYVALGDSITHGFQSGAVDETRQNTAYGCLLADKMNTPFNLPLLKFPGYLVNMEDIGKGNISWWEYYYPLIGGKRLDDYENQDTINNFGITGMTLSDVITHGGSEGGFYKLTLSPEGKSALDQALEKNPTFITLWLGNNDVLNAALRVDASVLTDVNLFLDYLAEVEQKVLATPSVKGVMIATVPDVTAIAYLDEIDSPEYEAGSYKPFWLREPNPAMVLTPDEIVTIREKADIINTRIREVAAANGWALVDANLIFNDIRDNAHEMIDGNGNGTGEYLTADYLGGIFSLDGVHPSITGHAMAANFMIDAINQTYGTHLEYVDEQAVSQSDSLFTDPFDPRGPWIEDGWIGKAIYFIVDQFM